jgi:hypothetical protein
MARTLSWTSILCFATLFAANSAFGRPTQFRPARQGLIARQSGLAARALGRTTPLSASQSKAVFRAHLVGAGQLGADRRSPARVGNYTRTQLLRKIRILRGAGFNKAERRVLVKKGVVGFWDAFNQGLNAGMRAGDQLGAIRRIRNGESRPGDSLRALGMNRTGAEVDAYSSAARGDLNGAARNLLKANLFGNGW